jgi:anti-sigma factor RsiW
MKDNRTDDHHEFKELAALALRNELSPAERLLLKTHLEECSACRQAYREYALISSEGMSFLAAAYSYDQESDGWDDRKVRHRLLARVRNSKAGELSSNVLSGVSQWLAARNTAFRWTASVVAACLLISVALAGYHVGSHMRPAQGSVLPTPQAAYSENKLSSESSALEAQRMSKLQAQVATDQQEIVRLRGALHAAEAHSGALSTASADREEQFRKVSEQRDKLADQLREAEQSYQLVQAELTTLRAEHDRVLVRTTSLESKVDELTAFNRDQDRRLKDSEQYLASDRDIRELMGARKLYIADVFDVDSGSRARKPFGRVFYTQSKSLIFYAFDLDRQPGVKTASAFQVWGKRDTEAGESDRATSLGILYLDSESNRRWVLRSDDQKQLSELDAVFVTVEPNGGSQKPTGKPFLYALLRREANHP